MKSEISVVIADDSATVRAALKRVFSSDHGFRVLGVACDGIEAADMTRAHHPDVVVMDIHMPRLDGYGATKRIMAEQPTPVVIVSAVVDIQDVEVKMAALGMGALSVLPKPAAPGTAEFDSDSAALMSTVRAMAGVKVARRWTGSGKAQSPAKEKVGAHPIQKPAPCDISKGSSPLLVVTAGEGGPYAIRRFLRELPKDFRVPIVIQQTLDAQFADGFVSWLDAVTTLTVQFVNGPTKIASGNIYVAPPQQGIVLTSGRSLDSASIQSFGDDYLAANHLLAGLAKFCGPCGALVLMPGAPALGADTYEALRVAGARLVFHGSEMAMTTSGLVDMAGDGGALQIASPQALASTVCSEIFNFAAAKAP